MTAFISPRALLRACLLGILALGGWHRPSHVFAASLLTTAIHDTDTVKTLQYSMEIVQRFSNGTLTSIVQGKEDEVRNREQDHQAVVERVKNKKGKMVTAAYSVNVVFLNGETYYQHPLLKDKTWHTKGGMAFSDGISKFQRGRTTVNLGGPFTGVHLVPAGTASNGDARFHGRISKKALSGTVDVLVSRGKIPYVASVAESVTQQVKGKMVTSQSRIVYGPFNQTLNITSPIAST